MKFFSLSMSLILFLLLYGSCRTQPEITLPDLVRFVNPLMGTESDYTFSHGNVYPAIGRPWGMNFWTPQTARRGNPWIYQYSKDTIRGFRHTHQPSPWMGDYGAFTLMALAREPDLTNVGSHFSHESEMVQPHYYRVRLDDDDILAEIVPTDRSAVFRFTFPGSEKSFILVDALQGGAGIVLTTEKNRVSGYVKNNSGGVPGNFRQNFIMEFNQPFVAFSTVLNDTLYQQVAEAEGEQAGCLLQFNTLKNKIIEIKISSSFISPEQAKVNLDLEIGKKTFEELKAEGFAEWNRHLNRIRVKGGTPEQVKIFYSCLYRTLLFPRKFYELNREGEQIYYSPYDGQVHQGFMFADNGFWDTFRAVFPFYTLLYPQQNSEFMQWLVNAYQEGGWLPIWPSPGYRKVMIGAHSASLFADAMVKGIMDFNTEVAFKAVLQDAMVKPPDYAPGRDGVLEYNQLGYVPYPEYREATAKTLEYAYDDFCISRMAKILGEDSTAGVYEQKAGNYKNVFEKNSLLMRGRRSDGTFITTYSPLAWGGPFTEGNAWHYTWSVFHDPKGLMNLMGGEVVFLNMMDSVFKIPPVYKTGTYGFVIHEIAEMVAGNMGQYAHGNQPVQHMIYLYNYAGQPWKAQYWLREVMQRLYKPDADGYCGDEDNGQTSAWYVFSAMGFYPVCPGTDQYVLGSPLFEEVTLSLENGKMLVIRALNNSDRNKYLQQVRLNGQPRTATWISHQDILNGGVLEFTMGEEPSLTWGTAVADRPYSMSD